MWSEPEPEASPLPLPKELGIKFSWRNTPPTANASTDELAQYDAYYMQDTDEKILYLTFDAGYENGNTEKILDVLKKHDVSAAFFVVGTYIESNPELVKRMCKDGHIVGNHTWHHPDMSQMSTLESFQKELTDVEKIYKETTGKDMVRFYRPPQGKYSKENLKMAQDLGYKTFFWILPMSTGTIQISLQKQKRLINCSNASTQARSSCSTAHQKQTPTS